MMDSAWTCISTSMPSFFSSMSAPLLGENEYEKRRQVHRGRFMRQLSARHKMNALTSSVNGFRHKLASMSASASTHHKKLPLDGNRISAIETSSHGVDTPPPPTPPLTSLVSQDMPQFDFAGSTNYFKGLDSANAAKSDDLSFSDDGVNLWELANTEDTEEIDFLLTQIMNNAPMYIRRTEDPIRDEELTSRPQNTYSISPVSSVCEGDIIEENYHAKQESRATDATDDSFSAWHDEEGNLDAYFGLASEPEELSVDPRVDVTCNGADDEEEDSIPDLFLSGDAATSLNVAAQAKTKNEDVDSALAWSALSFILGSPAPAPVTKKNSRKESAKLWNFDTGAECDDIPDLLPTGDELECVEEGILDPPDMIRVSSLQLPKPGIHVDRKDTFTTSSLTSDDTSLSRSMVDDSVNALGEDSIPDIFVSNDPATSLNVAEGTNTKNEDVDSALAWSALSFILGSPAPATVTRKNSRKESAKLWDFDAGECDDIPDLSCVTP